MAWAADLIARLTRRYRKVPQLSELMELAGQRVEIRGVIEPLQVLEDPVTGEACVAIDYRAWPPSTTIGVDGATAYNARAFQVSARQATDFVLHEGPVSVRVHVDAGEDLASLHRRLVARYGVGLRAESEFVATDAEVCVAGRVAQREAPGSPHRTDPATVTLHADRFWLP